MAAPRKHRVLRFLGLALGGIVAVYLVCRGIAEFFVIDYSRQASYRHDWGGPQLAGVLAVHSGPAVVIVIAALVVFLRRRNQHHPGPGSS